MTNQTKDDDREIGWAQRAVGLISDRMTKVENRFKGMHDLVKNHSRAISTLSSQGNADRDRLNDLMGLSATVDRLIDRMAALETGVPMTRSEVTSFLDQREMEMPRTPVERLIAEGPFQPGVPMPLWATKANAINSIRDALISTKGKVTQAEARVKGYLDDESMIQRAEHSFQGDMDPEFSPAIGAMHTGLFDRMQRAKGLKRAEETLAGGVVRWTPTVAEGETLEDVSLNRWIGEAMGAASMCWVGGTGALEFDSEKCKAVFESLNAHVQEVISGVIEGTTKAVTRPEDNASLDLPKRSKVEVILEQAQTPCPGMVHCWAAEQAIPHQHDHLGVVHVG